MTTYGDLLYKAVNSDKFTKEIWKEIFIELFGITSNIFEADWEYYKILVTIL